MGGVGLYTPSPPLRRPQRLKRYTPLGLIFNYLIDFTPHILRDAQHRVRASLFRTRAYLIISSAFQQKVTF